MNHCCDSSILLGEAAREWFLMILLPFLAKKPPMQLLHVVVHMESTLQQHWDIKMRWERINDLHRVCAHHRGCGAVHSWNVEKCNERIFLGLPLAVASTIFICKRNRVHTMSGINGSPRANMGSFLFGGEGENREKRGSYIFTLPRTERGHRDRDMALIDQTGFSSELFRV